MGCAVDLLVRGGGVWFHIVGNFRLRSGVAVRFCSKSCNCNCAIVCIPRLRFALIDLLWCSLSDNIAVVVEGGDGGWRRA